MYTTALELLHAIVLRRGYSVKNHVCLGYFIRDILEDGDTYLLFDSCRRLRNGITYYGETLDDDCEDSMRRISTLIERLQERV